MAVEIASDPTPLRVNADGVILVGNTRVPLDTIVYAYQRDIPPEEIARQYDALELSEVYAAIAYYLRHQAEVQTYLQDRRQHAAEVQRENEARFPPEGLKERLLARQAPSRNAPE